MMHKIEAHDLFDQVIQEVRLIVQSAKSNDVNDLKECSLVGNRYV